MNITNKLLLIGLITALTTGCGRSADADAIANACINKGESDEICDCVVDGLEAALSEKELKLAADIFRGDDKAIINAAINSNLNSSKLSDEQIKELNEIASMFDAMGRLSMECAV